MDAALADQIRAFELQLARTERAPEVHAYQRAAWSAQLALAKGSEDARDNNARIRAAGVVTAIALAPWLDRQTAQARIHRALGDEPRADAHAHAAREVAAADDARAIAAMIEHEQALRARAIDADQAALALGGALLAILDAHAGRNVVENRAYLEAQLAKVTAWSPGFAWAAALDRAAIRHRVPFDRAGWGLLGGWCATILGRPPDAIAPAPPAPPAPPVPDIPLPDELAMPTAHEASAGYRAQVAWADAPTRAVLERILALADASQTGPEFVRKLAEGSEELELARATHLDRAAAAIARAGDRGQPHALAHHRALEASLRAAVTVTEVEAALAHADACFAVESTWWSVLVHAATHAFAAAADLDREPSPAHRAHANRAAGATAALLGAGAGELLAMPWLAPLLARVLHRIGDVVDLAPELQLGQLGEVGYPVVPPLRAAAAFGIARELAGTTPGPAAFAARIARPRSATPAALAAHMAAILDGAGPRPPTDPARRVVRLWDRAIALDDLHGVDLIALRPAP